MKDLMLCTLVDKPFDGKEWVFETKFDGYRSLAAKAKEVRLLSRGQKLWNDKFPSIAQEVKKIPGKFILDGEIVILDKGKSNFQMLQNYQRDKKGTPIFYVFDILSFQGKNLTHLPLLDRKKILHALLKKATIPHIRYSRHIENKGIAFFRLAKRKNWEGIIAKKKTSTYQFRRSRDWLKIKTHQRQEFVIGGFTAPQGSRKGFGAVLVGVYDKGYLRYVGHVGGGFSHESLKEMHAKLKKYISHKCPFATTPKTNTPVTWIRPQLVCEVAFAEWTKDGKLRQPIFHGLRTDKSPKSVKRERPS